MIDFCVLGAGISGSTIARLLSKKYNVIVVEKAKGAGGRSSNRRLSSNKSFDHGVQYISPKSNIFKKFIFHLVKEKVLKIWEGKHLNFNFVGKNENKFIGKKGNNAISKYLLKDVKKKFSHEIRKVYFSNNCWNVVSLNKEKIQAKNLILSSPYPQSISLAKKYLDKKIINLKVKMLPNITVMAAFKKNHNFNISSIKFNNDKIAWAANENSKKRFKSNQNLWTIQCTLKYSKLIINSYKFKKKYFTSLILKEFCKISGFRYKDLASSSIHGWKYSYGEKKTNMNSVWIDRYRLGLIGDWFIGPKVEDAWLSANDLFNRIKKNPLIKYKRV